MINLYCIIQEIENKKPNTYGSSKRLEVYSFIINGIPNYSYKHSEERYERPIKTAYKVSLRKSFRENGKVKAKIWTLGTITYYYMAEYGYYEDVEKGIKKAAEETGISFDELYQIVEDKLEPLYQRIRKEYTQTDDYKASKEQECITRIHASNKAIFEKKYGNGQYDFCYDVFGNLMNEAYLKKLEEQRSYYEKAYDNYDYSSYFNQKQSNYNSSSYQEINSSNYTEEDKKKLKKCFKVIAKYFHPDNETGDMELMQFVNDKLKKEWGL